ncbi:unnamed protein product [Caenorhabditis nigoni]
MQPDAFGRLNFDGFDTDDQRMVSECSDACGCSMNCSRRQLQRGQKFGVVFYYEDECRQFGLRALKPIKRGQFILEYTGQKLEVIRFCDILDASGASTHSSSARIPIRQVIEAKIPRGCLVANRGQQFGGWTRDTTAEYPGIPTKYFTLGDMCIIQCAFEIPKFPKLPVVKYPGWDASAAWKEVKKDFVIFKSQ